MSREWGKTASFGGRVQPKICGIFNEFLTNSACKPLLKGGTPDFPKNENNKKPRGKRGVFQLKNAGVLFNLP